MDATVAQKSTDEVLAAIAALDLDPIKVKVMHKESGKGWPREYADLMEREYRRFLGLMVKYPDEAIAPGMDVDEFWHYHILDTMKYAEDCQKVFGHFLHHFPYIGLRGEADLELHDQAGKNMHRVYEMEYGEPMPGTAARNEAAFSMAAQKAAFSMASKPAAAFSMASKPAAAFSMASKPAAAFSMASKPVAAFSMASQPAAFSMASKPAAAFSMASQKAAFSMASQPAAFSMASKPAAAFSMASQKAAFSMASQPAAFSMAAGAVNMTDRPSLKETALATE